MKQTLNRMHPERFLLSLLALLLLSVAFAKPVHAWFTSCPSAIVNTFLYDETLMEDGVTKPPVDSEQPPKPNEPQNPDQPGDSDDSSGSTSPETPGDGSTSDTDKPSGSNPPSGSTPPNSSTTPPGTGVGLAAWDLAVLVIAAAVMLVIWAPYLRKNKTTSN